MTTTDATTADPSTPTATDLPDPQGPVPAPCPQGGHSPARPSSSAVLGESGNGTSERRLAFTATYDPADNKLRLRASAKMPRELYERVREAGYIWAPRQDLMVAPMWTPQREDLAIELAGEIGDEDTSLVDRAEQRADRFEGYQERRKGDAESALAGVNRIADGIPFGQPILVGHHSERHARRDAEKIQNGMRKAAKMWETSEYWEQRAAGALRHAKYKELPGVRSRRIKTIEADKRKREREIAECDRYAKAWGGESLRHKSGAPVTLEERVMFLAERRIGCRDDMEERLKAGTITPEDAVTAVLGSLEKRRAHLGRWVDHYTNRITYERTLLAESGYVAPPKPKTKASLPLLNYAGPVAYRNPYSHSEIVRGDALGITKAELAAIHTDYKGTRVSECGTHRLRTAIVGRGTERGLVIVYLTDSKQHARPPAHVVKEQAAREAQAAEEKGARKLADAIARNNAREAKAPERAAKEQAAAPFKAVKASLKAGVQVVAAPQLFPTPAELAARMVEMAAVEPGHRVLEPSAGTGAILRAIVDAEASIRRHGPAPEVVAVEVNMQLAGALKCQRALAAEVWSADFLNTSPVPADKGWVTVIGTFDRIVMNPPFTHGADIRHITHALTFLRPGGRLVAICANGPRQRAELLPLIERHHGTWEDLPADTFEESGTSVRAALISLVPETAV